MSKLATAFWWWCGKAEMITCLSSSGNKCKQRASSALRVFSKLVYKIIMTNITEAISKRLFKYYFLTQILLLNLQQLTGILWQKHFFWNIIKYVKYTKECIIIPEYILMYGPKRDELTEEGWSLHDEMVHVLLAQNILRLIKKSRTYF